jgi:ribosomal subunit interface protein
LELRITGRHAALGEKVKTYAREKLEPLSRYDGRTRNLEVVFDEVKPTGWSVELIAHRGRGAPVVASSRHEDPMAAIDLAHDKMETLLTRAKEKSRSKRRAGARAAGESSREATPGDRIDLQREEE